VDEKLKEAFKRAAEIASVAPESMHEAAFNRALDAVLGVAAPPSSLPPAKPRPDRRTSTPASPASPTVNAVNALSALDRSKAPEVDSAEGAQKKALALLLVARRELEIDGLTSSEMATVLTEKFRFRVTRQAINQAMDAAGSRVDRVKAGRGNRYRIMDAGARFLAQPADGKPGDAARGAGSSRRRKKSKGSTNAASNAAGATAATSKKATGRVHSQGPKAAVEALITAGWFATPRGLADIRKELEKRRALRFTSQDLAPAMTRLLREGSLQREKTASGQYEYHA
jgi:hypothetical protein